MFQKFLVGLRLRVKVEFRGRAQSRRTRLHKPSSPGHQRTPHASSGQRASHPPPADNALAFAQMDDCSHSIPCQMPLQTPVRHRQIVMPARSRCMSSPKCCPVQRGRRRRFGRSGGSLPNSSPSGTSGTGSRATGTTPTRTSLAANSCSGVRKARPSHNPPRLRLRERKRKRKSRMSPPSKPQPNHPLQPRRRSALHAPLTCSPLRRQTRDCPPTSSQSR